MLAVCLETADPVNVGAGALVVLVGGGLGCVVGGDGAVDTASVGLGGAENGRVAVGVLVSDGRKGFTNTGVDGEVVLATPAEVLGDDGDTIGGGGGADTLGCCGVVGGTAGALTEGGPSKGVVIGVRLICGVVGVGFGGDSVADGGDATAVGEESVLLNVCDVVCVIEKKIFVEHPVD